MEVFNRGRGGTYLNFPKSWSYMIIFLNNMYVSDSQKSQKDPFS